MHLQITHFIDIHVKLITFRMKCSQSQYMYRPNAYDILLASIVDNAVDNVLN